MQYYTILNSYLLPYNVLKGVELLVLEVKAVVVWTQSIYIMKFLKDVGTDRNYKL